MSQSPRTRPTAEADAQPPAGGAAWSRYGVAVASVAAATLLMFGLYEVLGLSRGQVPFIFFFVAVLLSARHGGRGPGLLSIALSALAADYFFLPPFNALTLDFAGLLQVFVFVLVSYFTASLTDRSRRAEEAAHASEESLSITLASIGDAVIATDTGGRVTFMNAVAEKMTGWAAVEARGQAVDEVFRIVNEETREPVESPVTRVLREGAVVGLANHTVLVSKGGAEIHIDDSGAPIKDRAGNMTGVVLVFHDISERRRAEQQLRRRESELTDFIENATIGLHWVGPDGRIIWANRAELEMLGYRADEYIGHHISEFHADAEVIDDILKRLTRRESLDNYEARLRCKDGSIRHVLINSNVLWDERGGFVHTRCFTRDITERRRAELDVEKQAALLDLTHDTVMVLDMDSRITFWNAGAERMYGWAKGEAVGRVSYELLRTKFPVPREEIMAAVTGEGRWEGELVHTRRDGTEVVAASRWALQRDERGRPAAVMEINNDITERRRAEEERSRLAARVELERERLKNLVGNVPGVVWEAWGAPDAADQHINFVSDYAEQLLGYTVEEWLGTPNFWLTIVHPEDRERAAREAHATFESGLGGVSEFRWVAKDGRVVPVEAQSVAILDRQGNPVGMRGVTMDITERKRAERSLRESERSYRALADAMPQIVWTARPDGYTDYYNRRWFEYTGLTPEQTEGWGWQPALHPDDVERCLRRWATAVQTGEKYTVEYRFRRASDGQYRWHLGRGVPLRDAEGRIVKWFGTATDIHDQKLAAERSRFLAEAGALLASTLDYEKTLERLARLYISVLGDHCLIDVLDDGGRASRVVASHVDPSVEAVIQLLRDYPPDMGKDVGVPRVLRTGRPEVIPKVTEGVLHLLARDERHLEILRRLGLKSFMTVPLIARERIVGALTFGSTGAPREYRADDLAFAEQIASRAALAIDNARLYRGAQEANRAKDEFLATLSHELRTPLTPILGWTHMLKAGRLTGPEAGHGVSVIENNAQALTRLINDLLDMSSILSGKMSIERAPVDLGEVVGEAVETVRPQAEQRGVRLEVSADGGRALVSGDRTRLVQVFWNLLNNAVKFSNEGGRVTVDCGSQNGDARVEVADEGEGIPPEFLPHVFERFRQADGSATRAHGGLGIGLALVKSFAEAHGGSVTAESAGRGRGSRFVVRLPLLSARGADSGALNDEGADGGRPAGGDEQPANLKACVLLVEDSRDTLDMLRVAFAARGYETVLCETAAEALRLAPNLTCDIIVSDIGLPQIDGYELMKRLREVPHLRDVPAVALTGYVAARDAEEALSAGFDLHVPKPVDPSDLAVAVGQLLEEKSRRKT